MIEDTIYIEHLLCMGTRLRRPEGAVKHSPRFVLDMCAIN